MAKFKVGDKVNFTWAKGPVSFTKIWEVVDANHGYFKNKPGVLLKDKFGETTAAVEDQLRIANSCRNSVVGNATFKHDYDDMGYHFYSCWAPVDGPNDIMRFELGLDENGRFVDGLIREDDGDELAAWPGFGASKYIELIKKMGRELEQKEGRKYKVRNSVVANALAWKNVCNDEYDDKLKITKTKKAIYKGKPVKLVPSYGPNYIFEIDGAHVYFSWRQVLSMLKRGTLKAVNCCDGVRVNPIPVKDNSGKEVLNSTPSDGEVVENAEITLQQIKDHAHSFAKTEMYKLGKMLRKAEQEIYDKWMKTGIVNGYLNQGNDKDFTARILDDYLIRLTSAINNVEGL